MSQYMISLLVILCPSTLVIQVPADGVVISGHPLSIDESQHDQREQDCSQGLKGPIFECLPARLQRATASCF
ncbi:hypothetical protein Pint_26722 [Pistacia integerrima]|uniref:Uncharacterized protein n=1 Tax=Pistacia integerrima TaxID=434235 RepID=A0ACC0YSU9_9ROSI|nr:hypothetical protein Pint_26722 [Pistacia integerrima]